MYASPAYPYQAEWVEHVEPLIEDCRAGRLRSATAILMISRQGGKNEISSRLEARALCRYALRSGHNNLVKSAPTFKPQLITSMLRLERSLAIPLLYQRNTKGKQVPLWRKTLGYKYVLGNAMATFLSGEPGAERVSETVGIALEIDEAQKFDRNVYKLELRPMLASTNAAVLLYGTSWIDTNLLEEERERARGEQKRLGRRLLFEFPWDVVAECNPLYREFALGELEVLGDLHPVWQSQYCLRPVRALGRLFSDEQLKLMHGDHPRQKKPKPGEVYVAGVDLNGMDEQDPDQVLEVDGRIQRDSTVVTICCLKYKLSRDRTRAIPFLRVVDHLFIEREHVQRGVDRIAAFLQHWRVRRAVVDAKGVGGPVARRLEKRMPNRVEALESSLDDVSDMGFGLIGAAETGRIKVYSEAELTAEELEVSREFWKQAELCDRHYRGDGKMRWEAPTTWVDGKPVHDDFVKSLGYAWRAAQQHLESYYTPPPAEDPERWKFGAGHAA